MLETYNQAVSSISAMIKVFNSGNHTISEYQVKTNFWPYENKFK